MHSTYYEFKCAKIVILTILEALILISLFDLLLQIPVIQCNLSSLYIH